MFLDESPEPSKNNLKKNKLNKSNDQEFTNKEKRHPDVSASPRFNRRGRMILRDHNRLKREDVRVTRGQSSVQQCPRGRPSLRRGRGRPPLTRAPVRRVLRNVRKVTNFAEDESETEDEEDEMFVESILSEEMERLEMGPGRLKPAKRSTSLTKLEKNNLKYENDSRGDQGIPEQEMEEKTLNKRKTRGSLNSALPKSVNDSSEEEVKRLTRSSKDKEVKERKRSAPTRRSRLDKSESDSEKNSFPQNEKLTSKRGRKGSQEKNKECLEKEKLIPCLKGECSTLGKKNVLEEKKVESKEERKNIEDSSARVAGNQSDKSVAYVLLSLSQSERWPESENDCSSVGENSVPIRSTRSSSKDISKEETKNRKGKVRNTSLDSGVINDKAEEGKTAAARKGKRESVSSETLGKTRSTSKVTRKKEESDLQSDDEPNNTYSSKVNKLEDLALKKREPMTDKTKILENKSSSESEDDKGPKIISVKSTSDDGSSAFSFGRCSKYRTSNEANENSLDDDDYIKLKLDSMKVDTDGKKEKRAQKKGIKKRESLEGSETDVKPDLKNVKKMKKNGSFQNFGTVDLNKESWDKNKMRVSTNQDKCDNSEISNCLNDSVKVEEDLKTEDNFINTEKDKFLQASKDASTVVSEGKRKQVMNRKASADSNASHSSYVESKVLIEPAAESHLKKINEKTSAERGNHSNSALEKNDDVEKSDYRKRMDSNDEDKIFSGIKSTNSEKTSSLGQTINENEMKTSLVESNLKTQCKHIKSDTSSNESEGERNIKLEKELENKSTFGSRKRFPRRTRNDYFPSNANKEMPKRTQQSRKVKSVNGRYLHEESYSSDFSSSSEESQITTIKSQKRIKPKNSTQNDAIESAMREAQNAALMQEHKGAETSLKVDSVLNKNLVNLSAVVPTVEISGQAQQADNRKCNLPEYGEDKPLTVVAIAAERSNDNVVLTHQYHNVEKIDEHSTLLSKSLPLQDNKFSKLEQVSQSNPLLKTNLFNATVDGANKQLGGESKKQSMSETWRQAFRNAKIPKPGQLSPVPHGVKPFFRKSFGGPTLGTKQGELKSVNQNLPKISNAMSQFKATPKYSPNRPYSSGEDPIKSQRDSPSKSSVSSSDDSRILSSDSKKTKEPPVKSLTQLQYEKRSSDLISSLKDAPIIIDPSCPVAPFTSKLKEAAAEAIPQRAAKPATSTPLKPTGEGKHLNLPLAVEHTLRKMSPITVSKKSLVKNVIQADKKIPTSFSDKPKEFIEETKEDSIKSESNIEETAAPRTSNIEILGKKKVNIL